MRSASNTPPQQTPTIRALASVFLWAALSWAPAAFAQTPNTTPMNNVVQLSASASADIAQDLLQITLTTTKDGSDANVVQTQLKTALDAALTLAKASASPNQLDVRTGGFSLYPRYDNKGRITGWQGSVELVLEGRDFPRISATAGKIQTLTMGGVAFSLSRQTRLRVEQDVQNEAIASFRAKAQEVAKAFGFKAYSLREVSVSSADQGYVPRPRMAQMSMAKGMESDAVPAEAGKSTVSVTVSGSVVLN